MNIGFIGPFGTANLGDYAMLINNIYDINPEKITIFCYNTEFPKREINYYLPNLITTYIEVKINPNFNYKNIDIDNTFLMENIIVAINNVDEIISELNKIDKLVISGGGFLNFFLLEKPEKAIKLLAPIYLANEKKIPIIFMSQGFGPFDEYSHFFCNFFNLILPNSKIAIRDTPVSQLYLCEINKLKNIYSIPDDLYVLHHKLYPIKQQETTEKYIVLILREPLDTLKRMENTIISFCESIYLKYHLKVYLLPFDLVWYGNDQCNYLHSIIPTSKTYDISKTRFCPIENAISIITGSQFVMTSRYHGFVLSLANKIPVIFFPPKIRDLRYSTTKGVSILETAFQDIVYDESTFIRYDLIDFMKSAINEIDDIIKIQRNIYSNPQYCYNKIKANDRRIEYIQRFIQN